MGKTLQEQLEIAKDIAYEVHKGQKRTIGRREDYIEHPKRVAGCFSTIESQIVAWLHDILECSELKPIDLIMKGISVELVNVVEILTRPEGYNYLSYILCVKNNDFATKIKIADIGDNLFKLRDGSLRDKYLLSLHILESTSHKNYNV